jgi:tRNA pseudouridine55 synthase
MQGSVLIIDKPAGLSSAQVVGRVKKLLHVKKVGHAGTLDPFATGVLVCLVNQATRLAQFFLSSEKQYEAELRLGIDTDTQDRTGQVIRRRPIPEGVEAALQRVCDRFVGDIAQIPPAFSALKHQGVALYKLARSGKPVRKPARNIRIEQLQIRSISLPTVRFSVTCSAGTYIRTLCADIGEMLGCGGHLSELRRTVSSGFNIDEAISLEALSHCVAAKTQGFQRKAIPLWVSRPLRVN